MQEWFSNHPLISYVLILGFTIYIFNTVFRPQQKLPILKEVVVYIMMGLGSAVLWVLQIDKLPIIQCMGIAVLLMLMLRARQLYDKWKGRGGSNGTGGSGTTDGNATVRNATGGNAPGSNATDVSSAADAQHSKSQEAN